MKTIAFFNNKGGVGKTTLVYHVAWMFSKLGKRIVVADLDPQANVTVMMLNDENLKKLEEDDLTTIYDIIAPQISDDDKIEPKLLDITDNLALLIGDLDLSKLEDSFSNAWKNCYARDVEQKRGFKITTAISNTIQLLAKNHKADYVFIDLGPSLGAINRCALIAADYVIVPVSPDIFSIKGLENVGKSLNQWRNEWSDILEKAPTGNWPKGKPQALGYVVSRFSIFEGKQAYWFSRRINFVPKTFHKFVLQKTKKFEGKLESDPYKLSWMKDYRSLMPMSMVAKKPIFSLQPTDGAIGSHQTGVLSALKDFKDLCFTIEEKIKLSEEKI